MTRKKDNSPKGMSLPKDREFMGLVENNGDRYWDFFWYATKADGCDRSCFVDRMFYAMPLIIKWQDTPSMEV